MTNLVHELQQAALDEKAPVAALLRKALLVASKLGVGDFETWVRQELEGYTTEAVPEYRRVVGTPVVWNPFHGWQHLQMESTEDAELISTMLMNGPIDALEPRNKDKGGAYLISYNAKAEQALMEVMNHPMKPNLRVSDAAMRAIFGRVRTIVLEWTLKLEKLGVVGDGQTFTPAEREQASTVRIDTLIHGVTGSQIQVHSPGAVQKQGLGTKELADVHALVGLLERALRGSQHDNEDVQELRAEVATLKAQAESPKPKRSVIRGSLDSLQRILEGATGELLASHLPQALTLVHGLITSIT